MASAIELLDGRVIEAAKRLGYRTLLPIQEKAIPVVLRGSHTLIVAPTGSGKTEAAVFPVLSMMARRFQPGDGTVKAIYITPLRSLNRDVTLRVSRLVEAVGFSVALRHGDSPSSIRRRFLQSPPDFMVTTPETLNLLLTLKDRRSMWSQVSFVIVDELQEVIDNKRGSELSVLLERIDEASESRVQRIGLSATLSPKSMSAAKDVLAHGRRVDVVEDRGERRYKVSVVVADPVNGDFLLGAANLIADIINGVEGSVLVFTNTRSVAERLGSILSRQLGGKVMVHHGSLSREEREEAERLFRGGELKALVATSSMELGIDIGRVKKVVQFMSPREVIAMTQRAGRSMHYYGGVSDATIVTIDNVFEILESLTIARRTERGDLEDLTYPRSSYDALSHQLAAMVVEGLADSLEKAWEVLTRTAQFKDLSMDQLRRVVEHLASVRVLKFDEATSKISKSLRTLKYLYEVSMIPDEAEFKVYDVASGKQVGEVSERFVESAALEPDRPFRFVLAGKVWEAVSIDYEDLRIDAKPVFEAEGAIPSWEGELIPVSYKTAREACGLLSLLTIDPDEASKLLTSRGLDPERARRLAEVAAETRDAWGAPLTATEPVVEEFSGLSVLYVCLGSKGNLLLGLLLSKLMEPKAKVWFDYIPYAIVFSSPSGVSGELVKEALEKASKLDAPEILAMAHDAVKRTPLFVTRFIQVAKRMGVLDPDARISIEQARRILDAYRGTVVEEETLREITFDKFDLEAVAEFLRMLREVKVVKLKSPSPLAREVLNNPYLRRELASNIKQIAFEYIVESLKRSALSKEALFVCVSCGHSWRMRASEAVETTVRCPRCGALLVAPLPATQWGEEAARMVARWKRGERLSEDEKGVLKDVVERAKVYITYASQGLGRYVVEALMNQGVGARGAKRVMEAYMRGGEAEFYRELLKVKEEFLAYSKFWDKAREGAKADAGGGNGQS